MKSIFYRRRRVPRRLLPRVHKPDAHGAGAAVVQWEVESKLFLRRHLYSLVSLLFLPSCQLPPSLVETPTAKIAPSESAWLPLRAIPVGQDAPTWDLTKKEVAESKGPDMIDDSYRRIKTSRKVIAITFDDGPVPKNTPQLLDMLKARKVKATFFVVGDMITRHRESPKLLRRMIAEGHEIGNHTVTHRTLSGLDVPGMRRELSPAHQQILSATGVPPRVMRPPSGAIKAAQSKWMLKEYGYPTIHWSCDPKDWQKPGASVVAQRLIDGATPGGILLLHDLHAESVDAVPAVLDALLRQGYQFVTISELISLDEK